MEFKGEIKPKDILDFDLNSILVTVCTLLLSILIT